MKLQRFRNLLLPEKKLGIKASNANLTVKNGIRKAYGDNLIYLFNGSSGIRSLSFRATTPAGGRWSKHLS